MAWPRKRSACAAASMAATFAVTMIVRNPMPAEKRIAHRMERLCDTGSAECFRSMGVLLGRSDRSSV
jgi:hypothetical protein